MQKIPKVDRAPHPVLNMKLDDIPKLFQPLWVSAAAEKVHSEAPIDALQRREALRVQLNAVSKLFMLNGLSVEIIAEALNGLDDLDAGTTPEIFRKNPDPKDKPSRSSEEASGLSWLCAALEFRYGMEPTRRRPDVQKAVLKDVKDRVVQKGGPATFLRQVFEIRGQRSEKSDDQLMCQTLEKYRKQFAKGRFPALSTSSLGDSFDIIIENAEALPPPVERTYSILVENAAQRLLRGVLLS